MSTFHPRRNSGCRLETDMTLWGYRTVVLQNELLRLTVLAGKGADIIEFLHKPTDTDFLWTNPLASRRPDTPAPPTDALSSFSEFYPGGWQELFPHGSKPVKMFGTQMYQHGEAWGLPWAVSIVEDTPKRVSVLFELHTRKTPFVLQRRMTLEASKPVVTLDETVHNRAPRKLDFMWGHHPAFGAPFLSEDCRLYAPAKTVSTKEGELETSWPVGALNGKKEDFSRVPPPNSRIGRMLYLRNLKDGWYGLVNKKRKVGFGLQWDRKMFPVVWIWQEANAGSGSPWFGSAYTMALEPVSHMPFARERGEKLLEVKGHGSLSTRLKAYAIPGGKPIRSAADLKAHT